MFDIYTPRFKSSQVAAAAGIPAATFRSYFKRKQFHVVGEDTKPADIAGLPHLFSARDALGVALAVQLIDSAVEPKEAWRIAMLEFAHARDERRGTGCCFDPAKFDETMFVHAPGWPRTWVVPGSEFVDLLKSIRVDRRARKLIIFQLDRLEEDVFAALGVGCRSWETKALDRKAA